MPTTIVIYSNSQQCKIINDDLFVNWSTIEDASLGLGTINNFEASAQGLCMDGVILSHSHARKL